MNSCQSKYVLRPGGVREVRLGIGVMNSSCVVIVSLKFRRYYFPEFTVLVCELICTESPISTVLSPYDLDSLLP